SGYTLSPRSTAAYTMSTSPGFSLQGSPVYVAPGATNESIITVSPWNGFTGSVSLRAVISSSPAGAVDLPSLSFGTTNPVTLSGADSSLATLTVLTTAPKTAVLVCPALPGSRWISRGGVLLGCCLIFGAATRRRRWRTLLGIVALCAG